MAFIRAIIGNLQRQIYDIFKGHPLQALMGLLQSHLWPLFKGDHQGQLWQSSHGIKAFSEAYFGANLWSLQGQFWHLYRANLADIQEHPNKGKCDYHEGKWDLLRGLQREL